jgi:hypothetical protein
MDSGITISLIIWFTFYKLEQGSTESSIEQFSAHRKVKSPTVQARAAAGIQTTEILRASDEMVAADKGRRPTVVRKNVIRLKREEFDGRTMSGRRRLGGRHRIQSERDQRDTVRSATGRRR